MGMGDFVPKLGTHIWLHALGPFLHLQCAPYLLQGVIKSLIETGMLKK